MSEHISFFSESRIKVPEYSVFPDGLYLDVDIQSDKEPIKIVGAANGFPIPIFYSS